MTPIELILDERRRRRRADIVRAAREIAALPAAQGLRLIVFGSAAWGKAHPDSDLDLLVDSERQPASVWSEIERGAQLICARLDVPLDLVFAWQAPDALIERARTYGRAASDLA